MRPPPDWPPYLIDYAANSKLRTELYYNDGDDEAGIQGVDSAVVYDADPTRPYNNTIASNFVSQTGSINSNDANVTLMDYQQSPTLEGVLRRQHGTVVIHCLFPGAPCQDHGSTVTRAYTWAIDRVDRLSGARSCESALAGLTMSSGACLSRLICAHRECSVQIDRHRMRS